MLLNSIDWLSAAWRAWDRLAGRLPHAVLIQAGEGYGAYEFAHGVAAALLCEQPRADRRACGNCAACGWFAQGNHPDYRAVMPDSLTGDRQVEGEEPPKKEKRSEQIRVEQVRALADFLAIGTHRRGKRVILVHPAEAMNANTQNALLKSLEEPPAETVFLLVATNPDRLLATVRSRCLGFSLPLPDPSQVSRWLKDQGMEHPEAALARAGGAPMEALAAADSEADYGRLVEGLSDPGFDPVSLADMSQKIPMAKFVDCLQRWGFDLLLSKMSGRLRYHPGLKSAAEIADRCKAEDITAFLRHLAQARTLARHPLNAKLFAEDLLLHYRRLILPDRV